MRYPLLILACCALAFCLTNCRTYPKEPFSAKEVPTAPNYSQDRYWAALPWQDDAADLTPNGLENNQANAQVDVFFLHPTTYNGKHGGKLWNGPVKDTDLNERTNDSPIQYQATIFNGSCRVFAPYYRQAHLHAYFTEDTLSANRAFDLAYDDVRKAFRYYLANHNQNRPIVIASHSQGTTHAKRLLKEFFDGKPLANRLVVAYLVGIKVSNTDFTSLPPCQDSTDVACYTSWRTFKRGVEPEPAPKVVVTNPLLWSLEETYAPAYLNKGAVIRPFKKVRPNAADAQVYGPILWASKPRFFGNFLLMTKNYHIGDLNIYYLNIRENVALRTARFLERNR